MLSNAERVAASLGAFPRRQWTSQGETAGASIVFASDALACLLHSPERGPSLPTGTPTQGPLGSMDANTWLSRQGSKGRQDSLPLTPDVFAAGAHAMTPGTVNVLLSPSSMAASTPAAAVAAPSPAAPLTVLLPRGARLLLRAARPTPVKEARPQQQQQHHSLEAWQVGVALTLLLSALIGAASYTLLHHQQQPIALPSTALVPYSSPASVGGDWYLVTHQIYLPAFLRLPPSCSPSAPTTDKGHHHLALFGICHSMELPLGRVEGLHPALLPALRLDLPALASVARHSAAAVTRAVTPTRLPAADLCGLAAVAAAAVYCARCLKTWHSSSLAASSAEATTPSQAACDDDDDWLADSEAEHVVASLPRQSSEDTHPVTPAHPRALSFSRAEEPLMDQGEATVKGGRRRRAAAPAVQMQVQGQRTRAAAGRRA